MQKPSERIYEIYKNKANEDALFVNTYAWAIVKYLDEQHEAEQDSKISFGGETIIMPPPTEMGEIVKGRCSTCGNRMDVELAPLETKYG